MSIYLTDPHTCTLYIGLSEKWDDIRDVDPIGGVCRAMARSGGGPHPPVLTKSRNKFWQTTTPKFRRPASSGSVVDLCSVWPSHGGVPRHSTSRLLSCISASLFRFPVVLPCSTRMEGTDRDTERERERDTEREGRRKGIKRIKKKG